MKINFKLITFYFAMTIARVFVHNPDFPEPDKATLVCHKHLQSFLIIFVLTLIFLMR